MYSTIFKFSEIVIVVTWCFRYLAVFESSRAQSDTVVVKGVPLDISRLFECVTLVGIKV